MSAYYIQSHSSQLRCLNGPLLIRDKDTLGTESEGVLKNPVRLSGATPRPSVDSDSKPECAYKSLPEITADSALVTEKDNEADEIKIEHGFRDDYEAPLLTDEERVETKEKKEESHQIRSLSLGHQKLNLWCVCRTFTFGVEHIPFFIFSSDFTIALGAGATVAFFPLYFTQGLDPGVSPMVLALVFASVPVLVSLAGFALIPLSRVIGRAPAALTANLIGTTALYAMCLIKIPIFAIATYLLRTAAMNSSYGMQRGILMDVVSKESRGKWSSVENLTAATWAGSSLVGGLLVERFSFQTVFFGTACLYMCGNIMLSGVVVLTWGE